MNALEIIPFILFLVVIGTAIAEKINVPYPIALVVMGILIGFIPHVPNWHPPSNIVLVLFLPPILFAAAQQIAWEDIKNNLVTVLSLSVVLVLLSALVITALLPAISPISVGAAFVLGTIISPTDTIAATSILNKMNAKKHLVRTLEIESLFNDAISIFLYQIAVLVVFVGSVDFASNFHTVILMVVGGIGVGLIFSYLTHLIVEEFLTNTENELPIIMSLILAYVAYLFAERIGASGVLAVVAAGLYHKKTERKIKARTRLSAKAAWDSYIFFLNGLIFIVIGLQFPTFLANVSYIPTIDLIGLSIATIAILVVFRFAWVILTALIDIKVSRWRKSKRIPKVFCWSDVLISSWAGMRGLVSLALALALPAMIAVNEPFPFRDLILFLTVICILFTLVVQGLTLPLLIKWLKLADSKESLLTEINQIYQHITKQAVTYIDKITPESSYSHAAKKLVDSYYANRLLHFKIRYESDIDKQEVGSEAEKLLAGLLDYERNALHHLFEDGQISDEIYYRILHKIDRDEVGFASYK